VSRPGFALAAIVLAGTIAYGALGSQLRGPSVFADELIYMDATRSVADGHRPVERDRPYGRGLLYPVVAGPVFALAPNDRDGYIALKWLNAFLFSLTAMPAYLLARRVVGRRSSIAVAALSVAAPSALYSGMVLTESIAYVTGTLALLAIALALEQPTPRRQLAALGAVVLAALARPQHATLVLAFPLGLALRWLVTSPAARPDLRALRRLWPAAAAAGAAVVVAVAAFASGRLSLKDYQDVWTSYDVLAVLKWSWYTLADLTLYLAVVATVLAPAVCLELWHGGRRGRRADAAFLGLWLSATLVTVLVVAAFSSASFGFSRLHDRYLFYVVPLWLIVPAVWLERGLRASRAMLAAGAALAVAVLATLPTKLLVHDGSVQFDAVGTAIWSRIRDLDPARPGALRLLLVLVGLGALGAILLTDRLGAPFRVAIPLCIAAVFVANTAIVWKARIADADLRIFADAQPSTWSWVDRAVGSQASVTDVYVDSGPCLSRARDAFRWTEFFNGSIAPVIRIGLPAPPGVVTDGKDGEIGRDGIVRTDDGRELRPGYVVAPPDLEVAGTRVARGTLAALQLWKVPGALRVVGAHSNADAIGVACTSA
jgi:hypothetical protein